MKNNLGVNTKKTINSIENVKHNEESMQFFFSMKHLYMRFPIIAMIIET